VARSAAGQPAGEESIAHAAAPGSPAPSPDHTWRRAQSTPAAGQRRRTTLTRAKATSSGRGSRRYPRLRSTRASPDRVSAPHGARASETGRIRRKQLPCAATACHSHDVLGGGRCPACRPPARVSASATGNGMETTG
jgi:hypothetical protein